MKQKDKFAVIYVRQSAMESPEISDTSAEQEIECRRYAKEQGYRVVGIFRDIFDEEIEIERVGFELMLDFIADGGLHAVIVGGSDPFPEDLQQYGYDRELLQALGMKLLRVDNQRE